MRPESLLAGLCSAVVGLGIAGRALFIRFADGINFHQRNVEQPPVVVHALATAPTETAPRRRSTSLRPAPSPAG